MKNAFMEKQRKGEELVKNKVYLKNWWKESQPNLTVNGIHKTHTSYDSYTIKQNEVLMFKSIYRGFVVLEVSKLLLYETFYDIFQPFFGEKNIQLHYMDTDFSY